MSPHIHEEGARPDHAGATASASPPGTVPGAVLGTVPGMVGARGTRVPASVNTSGSSSSSRRPGATIPEVQHLRAPHTTTKGDKA